jgi:16S rRNA U516 pseudouridylate synthase RsuA-like enzyme
MTKPKRKLTPAEKAVKRKRQQEFMTVFVNGKMKRVRRPPMIEGMPAKELIRWNADPIWLLPGGAVGRHRRRVIGRLIAQDGLRAPA